VEKKRKTSQVANQSNCLKSMTQTVDIRVHAGAQDRQENTFASLAISSCANCQRNPVLVQQMLCLAVQQRQSQANSQTISALL
jgi:hypothetical protein